MQSRSVFSCARVVTAVLLALTVTACGSDSSSTSTLGSPPTSPSDSSSTAQENVPAIVGRWAQMHSCPNLVHAFQAAGMGDMAALEAAAFGPDRPDSEMPTHHQLLARARQLQQNGDLCSGAHEPFRHFHFFSEDGLFGSLDEHLQQVDDGTYTVKGHVLTIGNSSFRYRVTHGDTLTLEPMITPAGRRDSLAHPLRFTEASWMVSVAYSGSTWKRVPCLQWC
jgi:hypothetical protein